MTKGIDFGAESTRFQSQLCHFLAGWLVVPGPLLNLSVPYL